MQVTELLRTIEKHGGLSMSLFVLPLPTGGLLLLNTSFIALFLFQPQLMLPVVLGSFQDKLQFPSALIESQMIIRCS